MNVIAEPDPNGVWFFSGYFRIFSRISHPNLTEV